MTDQQKVLFYGAKRFDIHAIVAKSCELPFDLRIIVTWHVLPAQVILKGSLHEMPLKSELVNWTMALATATTAEATRNLANCMSIGLLAKKKTACGVSKSQC